MNWFKAFWKRLTETATGSVGVDWDDPLQSFTPRARKVVELAQKQAVRLNHHFTSTEHLLISLIEIGQGVAFNLLNKFGLDLEAIRQEVERRVGYGDDNEPVHITPPTPRLKKVFDLAKKEADGLHHTYIGTEHLLLGLLREHDGVAAHILTHFKVDLNRTRLEILRELDPNFTPGDDAQGGRAE